MLPRHARSEDASGLKFLKSEIFAVGGLVLGIVPFRPLAGVVFGCLKIKVFNVRAHQAAETASLERKGTPDNKDPAPKCPMGFDPRKAFTKRDETRNVQNCVGIQVMELNPVCK
jgi:hypothetical protein